MDFNVFQRVLEGASPYFFLKHLLKYDILSKPHSTAICVTDRFVDVSRREAMSRR